MTIGVVWCNMVIKGGITMLTKKELCKELGISPTTVDRHMAIGMPKVKLGKSLRFDLESVLKWYRENPMYQKK